MITLTQARAKASKALAKHSRAVARIAKMRKNMEKYALTNTWDKAWVTKEKAWEEFVAANRVISYRLKFARR